MPRTSGIRGINFQNVNPLNNRANLLSGNLLPIGERFSTPWLIYYAIVMLIEAIHTIAFVLGLILTPSEKALQDGTICAVITLETFFMLSRFYARKTLLEQMVQQMNSLMQDADETMNDIVMSALKPITKPYLIYGVVNTMSVIVWTVQPVASAFENDTFFYVDYNLPTVFSTQPFSASVLISSTVVMTIGSGYLCLKKFSVDVYMVHLVLMLTAQYRYIAMKLTMLFQDSQNGSDKFQKRRYSVSNRWIEKELRALCHHQNTVLHISFMLRKLLSVNFSLLYVNNIFRFCFIGILFTAIPYMTLMEGISVLLFSIGSMTQFFLLCFSVQTLSDASTKITDKAFDEGWYQFGPLIKRLFMLLIMTNHLECKIAAIDKFNLSLPSFMTILNQSYSIALLFLRAS